jgi:hypothetical protein
MRIVTIIFIFLISLSALAQDSINQMTAKGQKTGTWIEYHSNGKLKEVKYYVPGQRILNEGEVFFYNLPPGRDTTIYFENILWTEKYEYNNNGKLKRVKRIESSHEPVYLYGPNKEIGIKTSDFSFIDNVNNTKMVSIILTNNIKHSIVLRPEFSSNNITTKNKEVVLPANQSLTFIFRLSFDPNDKSHAITLKNDSIKIDLSIKTFGYHVNSQNINNGQQLTLPQNFIYQRTGNEALLKLYDKNKEKELKTISLAKNITTIDLTEIKSGDYWLCIVDYSINKRTYCKITIEK